MTDRTQDTEREPAPFPRPHAGGIVFPAERRSFVQALRAAPMIYRETRRLHPTSGKWYALVWAWKAVAKR